MERTRPSRRHRASIIVLAMLLVAMPLATMAYVLNKFLVLGAAFEPGFRILSRVKSPDRQLEAVVFSLDPGATGSTAYHLSVVRAGENPREAVVFTMDKLREPQPIVAKWSDNRTLLVRYTKGRQFRKSDFATISLGGKNRLVRVVYR